MGQHQPFQSQLTLLTFFQIRMSKKQKLSGMTIVETVIYVAIIGFLFFIVTETLTTISRTYRATAVVRSLNSSALTSLDIISREIRNASSVDQAQSILNINPGKLVLIKGATTTEFYLDQGMVNVRENGVLKGPITLGSSSTTNLVFKLALSPKSSAIKIEMTLEGGTSTNFRKANFYNTVILRNSY